VGSSRDLIDCQAGRNEIQECQVGKGGKIIPTESSYQQAGVLKDEEEVGEITC
jgi:hypothetical protein